MSSPDLTDPVNGEDRALADFVTAYQEALAAGRPLPLSDGLSPAARGRWERIRYRLHLLARMGKQPPAPPLGPVKKGP